MSLELQRKRREKHEAEAVFEGRLLKFFILMKDIKPHIQEAFKTASKIKLKKKEEEEEKQDKSKEN